MLNVDGAEEQKMDILISYTIASFSRLLIDSFKNFKDFLSRDNSLYYGGFHLHLLVFPFVYQFISGKPVKIVKRLLYYLVLGMFMDKVKKFCDHI